jgi:hypothetical protein
VVSQRRALRRSPCSSHASAASANVSGLPSASHQNARQRRFRPSPVTWRWPLATTSCFEYTGSAGSRGSRLPSCLRRLGGGDCLRPSRTTRERTSRAPLHF